MATKVEKIPKVKRAPAKKKVKKADTIDSGRQIVQEVCQSVPAENGNNVSISASEDDLTNAKYKYDFTLNNYTEQEVCQLKEQIPLLCKKAVVSKEVGESGTPHLQGYISLKVKARKTTIAKIPGFGRASFRPMRNEEALVNYVQKKDSIVIIKIGFPYEYKKITYDMLRPEQQKIADIFKEPEDPLWGRKIYWYWEEPGNWGKSVLATYFIDQMGAMEVSGANNDILYGIANTIAQRNGRCPPIIIFDLPRSNEHISYQAIEKLKNGKFFSPKYESGMVRYDRPHIIVFANKPPDLKELSEDRWEITHLGWEELKEVKKSKKQWTFDDLVEDEPIEVVELE